MAYSPTWISTAAFVFLLFHAIAEERCEHIAGYIPIPAIDAVFYFRVLNLPTNEAYILEHLEILRKSSPRDTHYLMEVTAEALFLMGQESKDSQSCGIR